MIGTHQVTYTPWAGGASVDLSCLVDTLTIHHGRDDTASQPEADSVTVDMSLDTDVDTFPAIDVGGVVDVATTLSGTTSPRFHGRITDINEGWAEAGANTPNRVEVRITATGALADIGRRTVGDAPFPQELDGARVARIMALAGITLDPLFSDPGTVQILARDIDSQPALDVAQGTAESAGGILWSTRNGNVRYADANHRRNLPSALTLDACSILVTPTWSRTSSGLINDVSIGYGATPDGGDQPRFTASRADSIAAWGRYGFTSTTELAALADATAMGQLLLTRNHDPVWVMSTLPVDVAGLPEAETLALLRLDMHSLITLTGLPAAGTAPTNAHLWVEGWTETLEWGVHELELIVSGFCRTSPPPTWDEVTPEWTWDAAPGTWDDATCFGPMPSFGRWNDVPASVRWDAVPNTVTWDTASTWFGG